MTHARLDTARPDGKDPRYLRNAGYALNERARWERVFHDELVHAYAGEPTVLTASLLPQALVDKATQALSALAALPQWASEFVRRRQFSDREPNTLGTPANLSDKDIADALAPTLATAAFSTHVLTLLAARGIEYKAWVTRHDPLVRPTHRDADGQTVRLSEAFMVGGELLQYPADSATASIKEWINCRCVMIGRDAPPSDR
jgi:hypothetical protein